MEKCIKCGNKLSHLDVLCPRCCALVEKVQTPPVVPEALRAANTRNAEKPAPLPADSSPRGAFNSYAGSSNPASLEPPRFSGRSPSAIHGSTRSISGVDGSEPKGSPQPAQLQSQETERKNRLEIIEFSKASSHGTESFKKEPSEPEDIQWREAQYAGEKRCAHRKDKKTAPAARHEKRPVFLTFLMWLLAAGVLFGVFHFAGNHITSTYGGYGAFVREITAGKIDIDTSAEVAGSIAVNIFKATNELGEPAHVFEVSAAKGESVRLLPTNQTYQMNDGRAVFVVSDKDLARALGAVTSADTYQADNISLVITAGGRQITRGAGSVSLVMTSAPYFRSVPTLDYSVTYDGFANINILVDKDAKVYISHKNDLSHIDENGRLSLTLPLEPGENCFKIDIYQIGFKTAQDSFVIMRETE
ncbi:MAG: hypothetical protein WDA65_09035 [Christensenellales bacterium]